MPESEAELESHATSCRQPVPGIRPDHTADPSRSCRYRPLSHYISSDCNLSARPRVTRVQERDHAPTDRVPPSSLAEASPVWPRRPISRERGARSGCWNGRTSSEAVPRRGWSVDFISILARTPSTRGDMHVGSSLSWASPSKVACRRNEGWWHSTRADGTCSRQGQEPCYEHAFWAGATSSKRYGSLPAFHEWRRSGSRSSR